MHVELVEGPNDTDLRENMYTAALLAGDDSFDLVYMDVTWTPKFARWLLPLDDAFTPSEIARLLPAAVAAGRFEGRLYRIPVRTDVGLLYYRRDLLAKAGLAPPRTFPELATIAARLESPPGSGDTSGRAPSTRAWSARISRCCTRGAASGWTPKHSTWVSIGPEALRALEFLRLSRARGGISPPGVTSYKEDESRRLFQDGRAVFLRNWPYVWRLAQAEGSPVAGKVGALPILPADEHETAGGTLGGWGFGVSRTSRNPKPRRRVHPIRGHARGAAHAV